MSTVSLEEAQAHLPELIERLQPGEQLVITRDEKPVAHLTGTVESLAPKRQLGTMRGSVLFMAPDFRRSARRLQRYFE